MLRLFAAAALMAVAGFGLVGCVPPGPTPGVGANSAPYDFETNPNCGVFGTCEPAPSYGYRRYQSYSTGF